MRKEEAKLKEEKENEVNEVEYYETEECKNTPFKLRVLLQRKFWRKRKRGKREEEKKNDDM